MTKTLALKILLGIAIAGMLFSGYLSYGELVQRACPLAGACTTVVGVPACVYGFVMYLAAFIVSLLGLNSKK